MQVVQQCSVTSIDVYTDDYGTRRIHSVQTDKGVIQTSTVVNCTGEFDETDRRSCFDLPMFCAFVLLWKSWTYNETKLALFKTAWSFSGVWGPYLGQMAGVEVPLVAMKHAYVVTEKIEGIKNMPNVRDHDASVYLKLQGDALSVGGYESNPIFWESVRNCSTESLVIVNLMSNVDPTVCR